MPNVSMRSLKGRGKRDTPRRLAVPLEEDTELQFEAVESSSGILRHFDPETAEVTFPKLGPFWAGVEQAHLDGYKGQGRRIAIIDSAFDLSRGKLREQCEGRRCLSAPEGEPTEHGTAVALLINEVAPEAKLDLYEVARGGKPSRAAIVKSFALAAASNAQIINLSVTHVVASPVVHACDISAAAERAAAAGKVVVVAVGNAANAYQCPAQARNIAAVGYNEEVRTVLQTKDGGYEEVSAWSKPTYPQSLGPAFTLLQPAGVLGSSFAAPLGSALGALAADPAEIQQVKSSIKRAADASEMTELISQGRLSPSDDILHLIAQNFDAALEGLPHRNVADGSSRCPACAILTQWIYVNAGRFYLNWRKVDRAEPLLRQARWLAPWSADAAATLGRLIEFKAELLIARNEAHQTALHYLHEAADLYEDALRVRPGLIVYRTELDKIRALAATLSTVTEHSP